MSNGDTMDNEGGHLNHPHRWRQAKKRFRKAAEAYCRWEFAEEGKDDDLFEIRANLRLAWEHLERTR